MRQSSALLAYTALLRIHAKDFHDFIAEVVDDFHGDATRGGFVEGSRGVAIERSPGVGVDFGFEGGFEGFVGVVCTEEVGVADEEAFFVVVGVDEPAGDFVGVAGADVAGLGMKDIDAVEFDLQLIFYSLSNEYDITVIFKIGVLKFMLFRGLSFYLQSF